jgi:CBS domain-containing protein
MATKTAADVMTREVKTIPADATLQDAAALLTAHDISGAPVVDENGKMVGIVSESDMLSEAKRRAALPHVAPFGLFIVPMEALERIYQQGATLLVSEVMTKKVTTIPEDMPLSRAADLMVNEKINRVPVVRDGKLVGILTRHDVLRGLFASEG